MTRVEPPTATSERSADEGCVSIRGPHRDFHLTDALAWREGDVYVLKSPEFGVLAEDEDFDAALDVFVSRLIEYGSMLCELRGRRVGDRGRGAGVRDALGETVPAVQGDASRREC